MGRLGYTNMGPGEYVVEGVLQQERTTLHGGARLCYHNLGGHTSSFLEYEALHLAAKFEQNNVDGLHHFI